MASPETGQQRVVLITGPSGAGRSTAINALEDLGFEAIDNIPLTLIPRLLEGGALHRPLALGLDVRNREFSVDGLLDLRRTLAGLHCIAPALLYLDCTAEVLARRYSETRRRHPLAPDETPAEGIARELAVLGDVRLQADIVVDTSDLTVHDLRAALQPMFADDTGQRMAVSLQSFSYKRGLPQGLDFAFDCRFLRNPHWDPALRANTGLDAAVVAHIAQDERYEPFVEKVLDLIDFVLPAAEDEGKSHLTLGFGCTGGKHRSVAMTERVAQALANSGRPLSVRHLELDRRGLALQPEGRAQ